MKSSRESVIEKMRGGQATPAPGPGRPLHDVLLFGLVEIAAMGDPGLAQAFTLRGRQRRCVIGLLKQVRHGCSQRSRSRSVSRI